MDSEIELLVPSWLVKFSSWSWRGDASFSQTGLSMMGLVAEVCCGKYFLGEVEK